MSRKVNWTLKKEKVVEHLQDCPVGYKLENEISLSSLGSTPPSAVSSSINYVTDSNNTVCVAPANVNPMLNSENVKGEISDNDFTCPFGKVYVRTYDKDGNIDGTIVCVYNRPATHDA
jgi:hypothetical protein